MRTRVIFAFVVAPTLGALASLAPGCREPTEFRLTVTTNFPCSALAQNRVTVRVGAEVKTGPVTSESKACSNGNVGTVVVTPSGAGDHVTLEVMAALAPATLNSDGDCVEGTSGCIHSRRALTYNPHRTTDVKVVLEADCAGVLCKPTETCAGKQCVSSCVGDGCADAGSGDAGADVLVPDGGAYAALCGDTSALQAGAPYPMSSGCAGGSNVSAAVGPAVAPTRDDTVQLDGVATNIVIDKDNVAYVSTLNGKVHAIPLNAPGASPAWTATLDPSAQGSIIVAKNDVLYAASRSSLVPLALDGGSAGAERTTTQSIRSDLGILPGGRIVFANSTNQIEAMDTLPQLANAGSANLGAAPDLMRPIVASGVVFAAADDGVVRPLTKDLAAAGASIPLTDAGANQYVGLALARDGRLRAVWGANNAIFSYGAIDLTTRKLVWQKALPAAQFEADLVAVTANDAMWIFGSSGGLMIIDANGATVGTIPTGTRYPGFDVAGNVYLTESTPGRLTSYDPAGKQRWVATKSHDVRIVVVGKDGTIVATDAGLPLAYVFRP